MNKERFAELQVEHGGKWIALNGKSEVVASDWGRDRTRLKAVAQGTPRPRVLYCPFVEPWLTPDADEIEAIRRRLRQMPTIDWAHIYKGHLETALQALYSLEKELRRRSRDQQTHEAVLRVQAKESA